MHITKAAADIRQVDTRDAYHKFRGLNECNQGHVVFFGFHFLIKQNHHIIAGNNSKHIINESVDPSTRACAIGWLEWRVAKPVMNFTDDCINVHTMIIDEFQTLEKSNSATSLNRTNIFSVKLRLKVHIHKGTHIFVLL